MVRLAGGTVRSMSITLRPAVPEDLPFLTGGDSPFDDFGPRPARTEVYSPRLEAPGGLIVAGPGDEVLGNVSWIYMQWGPNPASRNPMIGIWLAEAGRGQGYGTLAQRMLVDLLFRHTSCHRIEAHTDVENLAEQRSLEKAGFRQEGIIREAQWRDGAYRDGWLYSILRPEWAAAG